MNDRQQEAALRLAPQQQTASLIERREYKYLIDELTAGLVRERLRPFCVRDPYAAKQPDGRYTIDSLYLDTPRRDLFHANLVERHDRFKLRIRTYPAHRPVALPSRGDDSATAGEASPHPAPVFFEVKRRVGDVISKARGRVARDRWRHVFEAADLGPVELSQRPAVERFLALAHTIGAQPITLVRYEREPWVSTIDHYARVTFDRRIRSVSMGDLSLDAPPSAHGGAWRHMDHAGFQKVEKAEDGRSATILELKFTRAVPTWLVSLVRSLELSRSSFSKYGTSIRAWFSGLDAVPRGIRP